MLQMIMISQKILVVLWLYVSSSEAFTCITKYFVSWQHIFIDQNSFFHHTRNLENIECEEFSIRLNNKKKKINSAFDRELRSTN